MTRSRTLAVAVAGLALATGAAAARGTGQDERLPQGGEPFALDPREFTTQIDNPWWPMRPGARWVYRETEPDGTRQRIVVTVTARTRRIANGVLARVVRDTVTEDGELVEDTRDWYAQDRAGNVWYLGERTRDYEDGRIVSTAGSFEAGVDGAQAGVVMPADPRPGQRYRQEHYAGRAEDRGSVVSLDERAQVPAGLFWDVVMTRDVNPLEPAALEFKFHARGVGAVLAVGVSGGSSREELVRFRRGR
jgi:hypothetical protein